MDINYFIPPEWYRIIFLHIAVFYSIIQGSRYAPNKYRVQTTYIEKGNMWFIVFFLTLFIGLRPDTPILGDPYGKIYEQTTELIVGKDWLFSYFTYYCHVLGLHWHTYLLICTAIYILGTTYAISKIFSNRPATALAAVLASFSFFAYCVNGVRNGLGCTMFLIALAFFKKKQYLLTIPFIIAASGFHNSLLVVIGASIMCWFYRNTRRYIQIWCTCIIFSLIVGDMMQTILQNIGFIDVGRDLSYFDQEHSPVEMKDGFRWDFLLYSAVPIWVGNKFVNEKKYNDTFYHYILNIYILVNSLWVLVNRNWLSNRIAFLSWFLYGLIIIYPILNIPMLKDRSKWLMYTLYGNAGFSYLMWIIGKYR